RSIGREAREGQVGAARIAQVGEGGWRYDDDTTPAPLSLYREKELNLNAMEYNQEGAIGNEG
uniref:Uncharacterized protein n=1 Tax=Aegilops tauschii subsp. strangulata TaxID=200361 RepID=A0A453PMP9_AEGTS